MIDRYSRPEMKQIWSDRNKFDKWLKVEIAVCESWASIGAIPSDALPAIRNASCDLDRMNEILKETHHDVTAFLKAVSENVGEASRFIHLGLTSSDVIDTALSLQIVEAINILTKDINDLTAVIEKKAVEHKYTIMMGRTHGVHAEPTTFGLKLALWVSEMRRNAERLQQAKRIISVGKISGAVGTYSIVTPEIEMLTCSKLGLDAAQVSNQIIQRDRHAQLITTLAIIASSLEKFALEIRGLQRTEVLEAEEPFEEGQTGSSAMPHKRNPELCERICGLARLLRGYALTSMENIALWHERDISHSSTERIIIPDSCLVLDYVLSVFIYVMEGLKVYPEQMRHNMDLTRGLIFSQKVLTALIEKGMSRQEAYKLVQRNAMNAWKDKTNFIDFLNNDEDVTRYLAKEDLKTIFNYGNYVQYVDESFARLSL